MPVDDLKIALYLCVTGWMRIGWAGHDLLRLTHPLTTTRPRS